MCFVVTDEDKQWAWVTKTKTEAAGLLKDIQSLEFLVSFHTSRYFLAYMKDIAKQLQDPSKDVLSAYQDIGNVITCICGARAESEECFKGIFQLCPKSCDMNGTEISIPQHCSVQTQRNNHPGKTAGGDQFSALCQSVIQST